MDIKHICKESSNTVENRSKGCRYVNSRHEGKLGKKLTITLSNEDADKLGFFCIQLDSSDSYYSSNTWQYAHQILQLLKFKGKL